MTAPAVVNSIRLEHLSKSFVGDIGDIEVLRNVSLDLERHQIACIVGPSGCGKTTLLNIIGGFEGASSGACLVDGNTVRRAGPDRGFVFQRPALFPWMTIWENITIGRRVARMDKNSYQGRAERLLDETGLLGFEDHYPYQVSGGMAQRVQLVRVLLNEPTVLLMDEPFGALDYLTRLNMHDLLLRLHGEYAPTILFITHDVDEAVYLADRVIVMSQRPGVVLEDVGIDIAKPRNLDQLSSAEFADYKKRVLHLLMQ